MYVLPTVTIEYIKCSLDETAQVLLNLLNQKKINMKNLTFKEVLIAPKFLVILFYKNLELLIKNTVSISILFIKLQILKLASMKL